MSPRRGTSRSKLDERALGAAADLAARRKYVAPVEVFTALGWLPASNLERWLRGQVPDLGSVLQVRPDRLGVVIDTVERWAREAGMTPAEVDYVSSTRDRRPLRFLTATDPGLERRLRTHWTVAGLSDAAGRRVAERQAAPPDLVALVAVGDWACAECGGDDDHKVEDGAGWLCLTCAEMDHLVFLPAGDATLTRRARKASGLAAVVLRWEQRRKRHRRLGLLVEPAALEAAEEQCLDDEEVRLRRRERDRERRLVEDERLVAEMTAGIRRLFPGCPPERALAVATHTAVRGSRRVGRSAAGRALAEKPLILAVTASVRHEDTDYDELLMSGVPRDEARRRIRDEVDRVLARWRRGGEDPD